jgi:sugar fermentation stimulation protein A
MIPLYKFSQPLIEGCLIKRYKRFLADVQLPSGLVVTAHCTNSGSMESCIEHGAPVMLSPVLDKTRKTQFTWEMIYINHNWVGVNTAWPNVLAKLLVEQHMLPGLGVFDTVKREVTFGDSRFDMLATGATGACYVEVKNVTMRNNTLALFPDAPTLRGQKHLDTLVKVKASGVRAAMLYIVQRTDVDAFATARHIDPVYSNKLLQAINAGVEVYAVQVQVSPLGFEFVKQLPIITNPWA